MKIYEKPNFDLMKVTTNENISSGLTGWLETNTDIAKDVLITTYHLESM